jgi:hypothetical protein
MRWWSGEVWASYLNKLKKRRWCKRSIHEMLATNPTVAMSAGIQHRWEEHLANSLKTKAKKTQRK